MANVYAVSYDLTNDGNDYSGLYEVLTSFPHWWHFLESTWLVVVDKSAKEFREILEPHVKIGDRLLIIAVDGETAGWLPAKAWEWIESNVNANHSVGNAAVSV